MVLRHGPRHRGEAVVTDSVVAARAVTTAAVVAVAKPMVRATVACGQRFSEGVTLLSASRQTACRSCRRSWHRGIADRRAGVAGDDGGGSQGHRRRRR